MSAPKTHTRYSARAAAEGRPMNSDEQRADRWARIERERDTGRRGNERTKGSIMTTQKTEIRRIDRIERLYNSVNGNPRFRFYFADGESADSSSDAAFCYAVGNPGMGRGDTVVIERTRSGRIRHMAPQKAAS